MNYKADTILSLFEENEINISRLYRIYSQRISGHKKFWEKLSKEEIQHAKEIRSLSDGKDDFLEANNFARGTIRYVAEFVENSIEQAKKEELSHIEALKIALRVEQSFLEKKCFEIFIPNQKKVQDVLKKLNDETQEHFERLQKEFERVVGKKN